MWGVEVSLNAFITLALDGSYGQLHALAPYPCRRNSLLLSRSERFAEGNFQLLRGI